MTRQILGTSLIVKALYVHNKIALENVKASMKIYGALKPGGAFKGSPDQDVKWSALLNAFSSNMDAIQDVFKSSFASSMPKEGAEGKTNIESLSFLDRMAGALIPLKMGFQAAGNHIRIVHPHLAQFGHVVKKLGGPLRATGKAIKKTFGKGSAFGSQMNAMLGPTAILARLMAGLLEPFELVLEPIEEMGEIIGLLLYPVLEPVNGVLNQVTSALGTWVTGINKVGGVIAIASNATSGWGRSINKWGDDQAAAATKSWESTKSMLSSFDAINAGGNGMTLSLTNSMLDMTSGWDRGLLSMDSSLMTFMGGLGDSLLTKMGDGFESFNSYFSGIPGTMLAKIKGSFFVVTDWFDNIPNLILSAITGSNVDLTATLKKWWAELFE